MAQPSVITACASASVVNDASCASDLRARQSSDAYAQSADGFDTSL